GCTVYEEKECDFFLLKYLIRGFHFILTFNRSSKHYYLNDLVDGDTFLHFFLQERLTQSEI
ncbi:hypothetical protein M422DRAFT_176717, partial [Sphaerobolus stellatus SS14]